MFSNIKSNFTLTFLFFSFFQLFSTFALPVAKNDLELSNLVQQSLVRRSDTCTNPGGCAKQHTGTCPGCDLLHRRFLARLIEKNTYNANPSSLIKRSIELKKKMKRSFKAPEIVKEVNNKDPNSKVPLPGINCPPCTFVRRSLTNLIKSNSKKRNSLQKKRSIVINEFNKFYAFSWLKKRSIELNEKLKIVSSIEKRRGGCEVSPTPSGCPQHHNVNCPGCDRRRSLWQERELKKSSIIQL